MKSTVTARIPGIYGLMRSGDKIFTTGRDHVLGRYVNAIENEEAVMGRVHTSIDLREGMDTQSHLLKVAELRLRMRQLKLQTDQTLRLQCERLYGLRCGSLGGARS